jgi:hypothetical protein
MLAKPTKKHADVLRSSKPIGADKKKSRPRRRHVAGPRRKPTEKRKRKKGGGASKRRLVNDLSKKHSGAETRSHGERLPKGPGKPLPRKLPRSLRQARSRSLLKRKKKTPPRYCGGEPGRKPRNRWLRLVAKRCVAGQESSRSRARSPTTKENEFAA